MIKGEVARTLLARNITVVAQALFGFIPAFIFPLSLQVEFYKYLLALSLVSMASLACESIANIRFPRGEQHVSQIYSYLAILITSTVIIIGSYEGGVKHFYPGLLWLIVCGAILNFKLLYISWLRVAKAEKLITFMAWDGGIVLCGCALLFFVGSVEALIALIIAIKLPVFFCFAASDLPNLDRIFTGLRRVKRRHLKYLAGTSAIFFLSSLFIVHQATLLRFLSLHLLSERDFVALSVALSVGANISKLILSYYWVIQKNIFSTGASRVFFLTQLKILPAVISLGLIILWVGLYLLDNLDLEANFSNMVVACSSLLMAHKIASASLRGVTLKMFGVKAQFYRQIKSLLIIIPACATIFFLKLENIILVLSVILAIEFFIVYIIPASTGWKSIPERGGDQV